VEEAPSCDAEIPRLAGNGSTEYAQAQAANRIAAKGVG
jgi:hypothetical protein